MGMVLPWPPHGFGALPPHPPSHLQQMFLTLLVACFDILDGLPACRPDRQLAAADALQRP
ncbi:putative cyclin-dependent kinase F-2 [Panicum miliaceum]|uniref:Cyclin-dependent kinase F-2 n=1 Tax=Panicum miliaceum TaxID=4540 RepID=A0A3L6Q281_PANMI|nr:putative cyclin-dependent kinase F-2 [Panicum miliaceum]